MISVSYKDDNSRIFVVLVQRDSITHSNSKFESVRYLALNLARALAQNNTSSKSTIKSKSKKKASRKDNTLLNLELLHHAPRHLPEFNYVIR
jgi:hypothetical protein|nr:hypothetical protein [uncultured Desulfobacter sp.]